MPRFPEKSMIAVTATVIALALAGSTIGGPTKPAASGAPTPARVAAAHPRPEFAAFLHLVSHDISLPDLR